MEIESVKNAREKREDRDRGRHSNRDEREREIWFLLPEIRFYLVDLNHYQSKHSLVNYQAKEWCSPYLCRLWLQTTKFKAIGSLKHKYKHMHRVSQTVREN